MFTADNEQLAHFRGPAVADVDDPTFSPREVELMRQPSLAAYVVTAERAGRRFQELGVDKPYHVIPQGVSLGSLRDDLHRRGRAHGGAKARSWSAGCPRTCSRARTAAATARSTTSTTCSSSGRRSTPVCRPARLWLVGGASERITARLLGRDDVLLFGRLPREEALATAAAFDLALYPRTEDKGIQAAKVGEFIGLGVPTVSYDYEVTENLRETGAGVLVPTPREFVDAVVRLSEDEGARGELAAAARRAGAELDWDVLARRYEESSSTGICRSARAPRAPGRSVGAAGGRSPRARSRRSRSARARGRRASAHATPSGQQLDQRVGVGRRGRGRRRGRARRRAPGRSGRRAERASVPTVSDAAGATSHRVA